jgi:hypothetical protein
MLRSRTLCLLLFFLALALRVAFLAARHELTPPAPPNIVGAEAGIIAQHLVAGHGFATPFDLTPNASPSTHLPPLYPFFLAGLLWMGLSTAGVFYVALALNLFASAILPVVALAIGEAAGFGRRAAVVGATALCVCPEALRAAGLIWDEALFTTVIAALTLWMLRRFTRPARSRQSVTLGLLNGLLALLNPAMVLAIPFAWLAGLRAKGLAWKQLPLHAIIVVAMTLVASSPWHVRNWLLLRPPAPVFIRGNLWLEVWSNLHPLERLTLPDGTVRLLAVHPWHLNGTETLVRTDTQPPTPLTEAQYYAWCKERALAAFRENPRLLTTHLANQFSGFWLGIGEARRWGKNPAVFFIAQGLPALLALAALYLKRKQLPPTTIAVFCALLIVFPLPYYLTAGAARYRHPIDWTIYLGAAAIVMPRLPGREEPLAT